MLQDKSLLNLRKTEDGGQKTEDRRQKSVDRSQRTEDESDVNIKNM